MMIMFSSFLVARQPESEDWFSTAQLQLHTHSQQKKPRSSHSMQVAEFS